LNQAMSIDGSTQEPVRERMYSRDEGHGLLRAEEPPVDDELLPGELVQTAHSSLPGPMAHHVNPRSIIRGLSIECGERMPYRSRLVYATERAEFGAGPALLHFRAAWFGLLLVWAFRIEAWREGVLLRPSAVGVYKLSALADAVIVLTTLPLSVGGVRGRCVGTACLGPLMTMLTAMIVLDMGCAFAFVIDCPPTPVRMQLSLFAKVRALWGVWESVLLSSLALQLTLGTTCWRFYKELRQAGLYPPNNHTLLHGFQPTSVSHLEICCEEGDIEVLDNGECGCDGGASNPSPHDPSKRKRRNRSGRRLEAVEDVPPEAEVYPAITPRSVMAGDEVPGDIVADSLFTSRRPLQYA